MWIILSVFLSFSVLALSPFEELKNVKIIRILPGNIVMLNRGLEDGILRNDHIMLTNEVAGYSSRAICIKASMETSYWKIYRVPHAEAFSLDYLYTIYGIDDKEIPFPEAEIRDHRQRVIDEFTAKKEDPGPDPFQVMADLPEKLTERDLIETVGPEQRKLFIEEALDRDRLKRELEDYQFSLYASPFVRQSINEGQILRYGIRGGNIGKRYRLLSQFEQQQTKLKDPLTKEEVSTRSTSAQVQFIINELNPNTSSLSLINYDSQRFSSLGTPSSHWQFGPLGFTWHLYDSKSWEYVNLSYIPLYDTRTTDVINSDGGRKQVETSGLRHGFRFAIKTRINERVAFENLLWVRPYQDLSTWEIEGDDLNLVNDLKLVFSLSDNLFFDYNFIYEKDKLWKKLNNLPDSNTINSVNIRYDFDV